MKQTFSSNTEDENYSRKPRKESDTKELEKSLNFTEKKK